MTRQDKEKVVNELKDHIAKARAIFLTNTIGLTANDAVALRKKVRDAKGHVVVTRNTLFKRAAAGTYCEEMLSQLKGTNALAFSFEDSASVAKAIYDTSKEHDVVSLRGGFLGEKELSEADVKALASLPPRDQLLATLLATFNAPVSAFARVLNAIKEQKEQQQA